MPNASPVATATSASDTIEDTGLADSTLVTSLLAVDPHLGGAVLRVGDQDACRWWLERLHGQRGLASPVRRVPIGISDDRLIGGIDLAASLAARRRVAARGLLAQADGGTLVVPFADRVNAATVWHIAAAVDTSLVSVERDGITARDDAAVVVIALISPDRDADDEPRVHDSWRERLAFDVRIERTTLDAPPPASAIALAQARLPTVVHDADAIMAVCRAALVLGVQSVRASVLALRAARAHAALAGRRDVTASDLMVAARLVLAPRAQPHETLESSTSSTPGDNGSPNEQPPASSREPGDAASSQQESAPSSLTDIVVAAARASIPADLLTRTARGAAAKARRAGRSGADHASAQRGRQIGVRRGELRSGRLDIVATLQAAAPWQRLRGTSRRDGNGRDGNGPDNLAITKDDFRLRRFRHRAATTTVFVVDASGSSARARLAEAKGAVELLLAASYARRDRVSLIAFGGRAARCVLPPTRALARARRELASLAAGGGTPLANGLDLAREAAAAATATGDDALIVVLTDGGANIARDGAAGRERAMRDALDSARRLRALGADALVIDCAVRPSTAAREIALAMGARHAWLPRADARAVHGIVSAARRQPAP